MTMRRPNNTSLLPSASVTRREGDNESYKTHSPLSDHHLRPSRRHHSSRLLRGRNHQHELGPPPPSPPQNRRRKLMLFPGSSSSSSQISVRFVCLLSALVLTSIHLYLFFGVMMVNQRTTKASDDKLLALHLLDHNNETAVDSKIYDKDGSLSSLRRSSNDQKYHISSSSSISRLSGSVDSQHDAFSTLLSLPPKSMPPPLYPTSSNPNNKDNLYTQQMTIRINSWKRPEQLQLSIQHFQTCTGSVALIQVIWCIAQGPVPQWLLELELSTSTTRTKNGTIIPVIVEQHEVNSLNERFHVLSPIPTAAVLSIDDDVLRPCVALGAAFLKWRNNPHRMVGFDARTFEKHDVANHSNRSTWKYGYLSSTEHMNRYAVTLTRFAILHQHYLNTYVTDLPISIRTFVDDHFNCEDIAMSLWVSYQTNNLPPLLADFWAMKTQLKLYSPSAISSTNDHKQLRDICVQQFTSTLQLNIPHLLTEWVHYSSHETWRSAWFDCGAPLEPVITNSTDSASIPLSDHLQDVQDTIEGWKLNKDTHKAMIQHLNYVVREMARPAHLHGYIKDTEPWKEKFKRGSAFSANTTNSILEER